MAFGAALMVAIPPRGLGIDFHPVLEDRRVEIDAGFVGKSLAELVAQDAGLDLLHRAFRQLTELEGSEGDADQPVDLKAEAFQHALHFAVLAFAQAQCQPAVGALGAIERGVNARIVDAIDGDAVTQGVERGLIGLTMGAHAVAPQPAGGGQFEQAGKSAIVGKQQQAFGVDIEAADGDDARQALGQGFEDCRATFRIARRGHEAARLVVHPQARALALGERLAVDHDAVLGAHVEGRAVDDLAVHLHAAGGDPLFGVAARAEASAGHDLGDALLALAAFMGAHGGGRGLHSGLLEIGLAAHGPIAAEGALAKLRVAVGALLERALATRCAGAGRTAAALVVAGSHETATLVLARGPTFARLAEFAGRARMPLVTGFAGAIAARTGAIAKFAGASALLAEAAPGIATTRLAGTALVVVSFVVHAS